MATAMTRVCLTMCACAVAATMAAFQAHDNKKPASPPPTTAQPDSKQPAQAADKAMQDEAPEKPGPQHEQLAKHVGEWTTATKIIMQGAPAMESKGSVTIKMTLDGRFLQESADDTMMGAPVQSLKFTGYNTGSGKYEAVWMWTMNTSMMTMTGSSSDDGKTITFDAGVEQAKGKRDKLEITQKDVDDDHFVVTIKGFDPDPAQNAVMETTYTRRK
jgi:hypothetical protein